MNGIGIDLSLRSTGLCFSSERKVVFELVQLKKENDEELIIESSTKILEFINNLRKKEEVDYINLEGLSFGSTSSSKDILAGNFWFLRCILKTELPDIPLRIIPVSSWRSPLFNKEERRSMKESDQKMKELKKLKNKDLKDEIKSLDELSSIKHQTYLKLPEIALNNLPKGLTGKNGLYDLTDAYFISRFTPKC